MRGRSSSTDLWGSPAAAPASWRSSARPGKLSETRSTRDTGLLFRLPSAAPLPVVLPRLPQALQLKPCPSCARRRAALLPCARHPAGMSLPEPDVSPQNSTSASDQNGGYSQLCQLLRPHFLRVLLPAFWKLARICRVPRGDPCGWIDFCLYAACFKSSAKLILCFPLSSLYTEP